MDGIGVWLDNILFKKFIKNNGKIFLFIILWWILFQILLVCKQILNPFWSSFLAILFPCIFSWSLSKRFCFPTLLGVYQCMSLFLLQIHPTQIVANHRIHWAIFQVWRLLDLWNISQSNDWTLADSLHRYPFSQANHSKMCLDHKHGGKLH